MDLSSYKAAIVQANDVTAASSEDILRLLKLSLLYAYSFGGVLMLVDVA